MLDEYIFDVHAIPKCPLKTNVQIYMYRTNKYNVFLLIILLCQVQQLYCNHNVKKKNSNSKKPVFHTVTFLHRLMTNIAGEYLNKIF